MPHNGPVSNQELLAQVRELREGGNSPKEIANLLGVRPSAIAPLVRKIAAQEQANLDPADRALLGCWISSGWSAGLGLDSAPPEWAENDPIGATNPTSCGLVGVLIARQERASRSTVCGFLVDVYCLGVKNTIGPLSMGFGSVTAYSRKFFGAFDGPPVSAPVDLAQHVVHGAVAYARTLGFEPHPEFAATAPHLGTPPAPTPIVFGREGRPFYIQGPDDDQFAIARALESAAARKQIAP